MNMVDYDDYDDDNYNDDYDEGQSSNTRLTSCQVFWLFLWWFQNHHAGLFPMSWSLMAGQTYIVCFHMMMVTMTIILITMSIQSHDHDHWCLARHCVSSMVIVTMTIILINLFNVIIMVIDVRRGIVRCGEHSDYGTITILFQVGAKSINMTIKCYFSKTF